MQYSKKDCELLRYHANQRFDKVRGTMIECGKWILPNRIKWLLSQNSGERTNQHLVDHTHTLALRSCVAGFLEGNTSATRPWYRIGSEDPDAAKSVASKEWLEAFNRRTLKVLNSSNYYHEAGQFYYDYHSFNTGVHYIDELKTRLHFHTLEPGSYKLLNNGLGEAVVLVREFCLTVKALVDTYGVARGGVADWSNFSSRVRKMYEDGNYTQEIDIVHIVKENTAFDPYRAEGGMNRRWVSLTYELGGGRGQYYQDGSDFSSTTVSDDEKYDDNKFLKVVGSKRKPFIAGRSPSSGNFEYGETGPTTNALGLIKSLQKKAIGKDQALELILKPPTQGPASLKKSYVSIQSNTYVPLDVSSATQGGLKEIFQVNPAIAPLLEDVSDLRQMVDKLYYADYLLYLSRNPKTRTATETNAIVQEQQLIIGPNLQSLNYTYNMPLVEFVMDYVLDKDPYLPPPPEELAGKFLRTEFISVFAQAQKAADLPAVDRYLAMVANVGAIQPSIWDKANLDKLCDLYEDRLFLPAGLNVPQAEVDAKREKALAEAQRRQMLQETLPAVAGAAKDVGLKAQQ